MHAAVTQCVAVHLLTNVKHAAAKINTINTPSNETKEIKDRSLHCRSLVRCGRRLPCVVRPQLTGLWQLSQRFVDYVKDVGELSRKGTETRCAHTRVYDRVQNSPSRCPPDKVVRNGQSEVRCLRPGFVVSPPPFRSSHPPTISFFWFFGVAAGRRERERERGRRSRGECRGDGWWPWS